MRSRRSRCTGCRRARAVPAPSRPRRTARGGSGGRRRRPRAPAERGRWESAGLRVPRASAGAAGGRGKRPGAVTADLDRPRLVAVGIERLDDGARRRERDLVLARAAARENGDAEARVTGSESSSVSVGVDVGGTKTPTKSVITVFGSCWVLPGRILRDDDAVERLDVGVLLRHDDLEAGVGQRRRRVARSWAGHVGQRRRLRAVRDREVSRSSPSWPSRSRPEPG